MSNRFFSGPLTSGMGRKWDDWSEAEPQSGNDAQKRRFRDAADRPRLCLVQCPALLAVNQDDSGRTLKDPIAPRP